MDRTPVVKINIVRSHQSVGVRVYITMCGLAGFGILLAVGFLGFNVNFRKQRYGIKWSMCLENVIEYVSNFSVDFFGKSREDYMCCRVLSGSGL